MMDRRAFLKQLGFGTISAAAAALTWDIERLLWVPGEKSIFLPSPCSQLLFHPDAFALITAPLSPQNERLLHEAAQQLADAIDAKILEHVYARYGQLELQRVSRFRFSASAD